ncbi:MAG: ribulose-phosphate 3-epimerase [Clostridia bacterium]|nr:ribulose-phosphate 3-epimerase [Clostridia bacterium]
MVKISPSVLACDFSKLGEELESIHKAGAEMAHLDVMDGMFVTNISFGLPVIESVRKVSSIFFDVHLMIEKPERYIDRFIDAGADLVTFHIEATDDVAGCIDIIKKRGKAAAVSVKPGTPVEEVYPYLEMCDMILVMTVEPGYGGQALIPECIEKVRKLRAEITKRGLNVDVQVDGGVNEKNAATLVEAGANVLVAGSAVFKYADRKAAIDALR